MASSPRAASLSDAGDGRHAPAPPPLDAGDEEADDAGAILALEEMEFDDDDESLLLEDGGVGGGPVSSSSAAAASGRAASSASSSNGNAMCRRVGDELKCTACDFTTRSRIMMQRHERLTHLKKKFFRCVKCNYVTHVKARYTKHVKYHSMPMIKCDLCEFRTPYKWNLDRHLKNHMGGGMYKCSLCNFTAHIKQSLTVHIQNHHLSPEKARSARRRNKVRPDLRFILDSPILRLLHCALVIGRRRLFSSRSHIICLCLWHRLVYLGKYSKQKKA